MSDTEIPTLNPLTADQVLALEVDGAALWFIKNTTDGSEKAGPFSEENLRDYVLSHQEFSADFVANKLGSEEWTTLVELAEFKRKPKLVSMAAINVTAVFYLLENGHKIGPFNETEINEKLKSRTVIFSDFISVDKGFNWLKVFELPQFDGRTANLAEALPLSPAEEIFKTSKLQGLKNIQDNQVAKDILAFVAFASKRKNEAIPDVMVEEKNQWWGNHKKAVYASLCVMIFASISWKYYSTTTQNVAEGAEAENIETMFAHHPTNTAPALNGIAKPNKRLPANENHPRPMQLNHHNSQANNVPVPIEDAQINYDEPPPADAPDPVEPPPPPMEQAQMNPPEEPQQIAEAEPMPEMEREPASDGAAAPPPPPGKEEEMFNQEAQN